MLHQLRKILHPILRRYHSWYTSRPHIYRYRETSINVMPGVFSPYLTISTSVLLDFVSSLDLRGKQALELGCGSGILSIVMAKRGAICTASDINTLALESLKENSKRNSVSIDICYSNLFENLLEKKFDFILINPPYYPRNPSSVAEQAWFCGEQFEYFEALFVQLPEFIQINTFVYMILSQDCKIDMIMNIAKKHFLQYELIQEKKVSGEKNFIFRITK